MLSSFLATIEYTEQVFLKGQTYVHAFSSCHSVNLIKILHKVVLVFQF